MPTKSRKRTAQGAMALADVYGAPGHLIRRSQQIAVAIFFDEIREYAVTPVQYASLVAIKERPGVDQRTLGHMIAMDRSTLGSTLKRLEQRRLVLRVTPKHNQRIKQLFITPAGLGLLASSRKAIDRVQERILSPLNPGERAQFTDQLARLVYINNDISRAPLKILPREPGAHETPGKPRKRVRRRR